MPIWKGKAAKSGSPLVMVVREHLAWNQLAGIPEYIHDTFRDCGLCHRQGGRGYLAQSLAIGGLHAIAQWLGALSHLRTF